MMPPTQPSMPTAGVPNTATNNNWQNPQQGYQNTNMMYQQPQQQQQQQPWPQQASVQQQTGTAAATYDNLFNHQQQQVSNNMYQQQQQQQHVPPVANYFQQSAPTTAPPPIQSQQQQQPPQPQSLTNVSQTNAINFFDNANNNQPSTGGDGWGDWDWNDNSTIETTPTNEIPTQQSPPPQQQPQQIQPLPQQLQPPANVANDHSSSQAAYNPNIIADSFHQQNNDSWNWNTPTENEQNVVPPSSVVTKENNNNSSGTKVEQHNDNWNWTTNNDSESQQQQQQTVATNDNTATNDNWNWQTNDTNQQQILAPALSTETPNVSAAPKALEHHVAQPAAAAIQVATSTSVAPPPTEFSSNSLMENHNYNTNSVNAPGPAPPTSAPTNIPNTVFVSQAKPVTLPSRQYASPPMGNTPITENPPESALMPPQGFQNAEEATINRPANIPPVMTTAAPHPPPPGNAAPPPVGLPPAAAAAGNPFKRSGLAQHHRATALMSTVPTQTNVFNMPPPPPADFANPSSTSAVTLMEPENNELPSQENQEILTSPAPTMHHPQPSVSSITLSNASAVTTPASAASALPPPNDERNQYLQTSHLSENSEEQQPEADGLLPPPGLSRLVLGEPELEASQRMVMGTEAPPVVGGNTATVTDVMHLEERHADGEDTASENAVPVISTTIASGQGGKMRVLKISIDVTKMISFFICRCSSFFQLLDIRS